MKKIVTGALAFLLITGAAQAQKADSAKTHRKHPVEQLNLTAEQKTKLQAIKEQHRKAWQDLKSQESKLTVEQWKARRQELMEKQRAEMKSVLTPEQQQQMEKMRTGHHRGMKGAFREKGRHIGQQLSLTEAQKTKIKELNQSFHSKREALRSNATLAEAQKKEQLKALAQQHRQELKALLTPEQQRKMESLRGERRSRTGK